MFKEGLLRGCVLVAVIAVSGCATGPAFKKVDQIPPGKALIYVYRPASHGAAVVPGLVFNQLNSVSLTAWGYYPHFAEPGPVTIAVIATGRTHTVLDARAGETYYVRGGTIFMAMGATYVEQVPEAVALPQLADCKRIPNVAGVDAPPEQ
jgi:hypothetical protein